MLEAATTAPVKLKITSIAQENYKAMPWKNGLGVTNEIAIAPAGADFRQNDFLWRISMARVEQDGAFSQFPGYRRWLTVIDGAGLRLSRDSDDRTLARFEPYEFSGEFQHQGFLTGGPILDLSVFIREDKVRADVAVKEWTGDFAWTSVSACRFAVALSGGFGITGGSQAVKLKPLSALRIDGPGEVKFKTSPGGGRVLLISLEDL